MSSSRLRKDIQSLYASPPADIILSDFPSDLTQLTLSIIGPAGTPFESHEFQLALKIPSDYPCRPPTVAFRTKIFHPNIHPGNGDVCVDTLKRDWTTALDLIQVLVTIRCLLIEPNPASALNEDAGKLILHDWNEWVKKAKLMTRIHASKIEFESSASQPDCIMESSIIPELESTSVTVYELHDIYTSNQSKTNSLAPVTFRRKKKIVKKRIGLRRL